MRSGAFAAFICVGLACGDGGSTGGLFGEGGDGSTGQDGDGGGTQEDDGSDGDDGGGPKLDVGSPGGGGAGSCFDEEGGDVGECEMEAPPDSFEPEVQWTFDVDNSIVTPLVANLTDDDGDGQVTTDDVPDVVVVVGEYLRPGTLYVLDGATGAVHYTAPTPVVYQTTPAIGDIDGDGTPEIVTADDSGNGGLTFNLTPRLVAFEHDGTVKWTSAEVWNGEETSWSSIALADLDNDGDVEIIAGATLFDHLGNLLWRPTVPLGEINSPTAADLDGDDDLEIVVGNVAYHHDGSVYYRTPALDPPSEGMFPQIADLDGDDEPEIVVSSVLGVAILEHDGTIKLQMPPPGGTLNGNLFPATVHDFDGDGQAEFAVGSGNTYSLFEADMTLAWSAPVLDASGVAAGTAFDFLGDGVAEAMYADESTMYVFDGKTGAVVLQVPRSSGTGMELPTVADVDNDGSAEIVVVSNNDGGIVKTAPTVQVIRDRQDRWIQARRIWNQHTYHVTNVNEDGTIPQFEKPSWRCPNTFRTNAQIEGGSVCIPPVG